LVLSKHKADTTIQFIDASALFKKDTNTNSLLDTHIDQIMSVFDSKASVDHFAQSVSHERIAELIGTTRVTTTRLISRIRQEKLLEAPAQQALLRLAPSLVDSAPLATT
jgi:CRP-like cAMP-binding protein